MSRKPKTVKTIRADQLLICRKMHEIANLLWRLSAELEQIFTNEELVDADTWVKRKTAEVMKEMRGK